MSKGGRPLDPIHGYFEKVHGGGKESLKGRNCKEKVNGKADRMRKHFAKCCGKKKDTRLPLAKHMDQHSRRTPRQYPGQLGEANDPTGGPNLVLNPGPMPPEACCAYTK